MEINPSDQALAAWRMVSGHVIGECQAIITNHDLDLETLSPFWIYSIYQVSDTLLQLRGSPNLLGKEEQAVLMKALQIYDRRWKCAGTSCLSSPL